MTTTDKQNSEQSVSDETPGIQSGRRTDTSVKLTEIGAVSLETKGISRGLELSFTPKN